MKNLVSISYELMNRIASYMDDDLREQTHFAVAPCSNEVFITEYYNNLTITEEDLDELQADYNINILPMNSVFAHKNEKAYIITMASGDLTVFCQEV